MEHLLGDQPHRWVGATCDRLLPERDRHFRGPPGPGRAADPRALHVVEHHEEQRTLGAGLLPRRRQDLGEELDYDDDACRLIRARANLALRGELTHMAQG